MFIVQIKQASGGWWTWHTRGKVHRFPSAYWAEQTYREAHKRNVYRATIRAIRE